MVFGESIPMESHFISGQVVNPKHSYSVLYNLMKLLLTIAMQASKEGAIVTLICNPIKITNQPIDIKLFIGQQGLA